MSDNLFRKTNIDKISSPEQLNEYIHVTKPGVWLVLSAVIIFLIGMIVWSFWGTIEMTVDGTIVQNSGNAICYIKTENSTDLKEGMMITSEGKTGTVKTVASIPTQLDEETNSYLLYTGDFFVGEFCFTAEVEIADIVDGIYPAKITVDSIHPILFVIR